MLYCDLDLNNTPVWRGFPCLLGVPINKAPYFGFQGELIFAPVGAFSQDPIWQALGTGCVLLFQPTGGPPNQVVPLQAVPAQQLNIVLEAQNCTLSIYEKPTDAMLPIAADDVQYADNYADAYYVENS